MARIEADGKEDYTGHQGQLGKFAPTTGGVKKTTPFQAGNSGFERDQEVLEEHVSFLIRKLPFQRLVREIAQDFKTDLRFHSSGRRGSSRSCRGLI
ncbi:hypothetical protein CUMW_281240 [Citrus unshiu]|uniref:Core Histone H2A/H2B/H3 domain-containing protein n=1 Tax=Citrus unshiu TaxID=55188 RepID=A0A2H5MWQ5_CITUN|nr:hypothetical protein CUMW_281240 [Citrus unshiu]